MNKILVTGSSGQLGNELNVLSKKFTKFKWIFLNRNKLNFIEINSIKKKISIINPDYIINCAAFTDVDKAEEMFLIADKINNKAVGEIAEWTFQNNKKLIHISTDYVFCGNYNKPIKENDKPSPINKYGKTKLNAEKVCVKKNPNSIIIRSSWMFSIFGSNFLTTIFSLINEKKHLNVVNDQIGSPTSAFDLATVIIKIIMFKKWSPGIYNYTNEEQLSWYEFALDIKKYSGNKKVKIIPIKSPYYKNIALRPKYSVLDKSKIKTTFDVKSISYKLNLKKCINFLINEK